MASGLRGLGRLLRKLLAALALLAGTACPAPAAGKAGLGGDPHRPSAALRAAARAGKRLQRLAEPRRWRACARGRWPASLQDALEAVCPPPDGSGIAGFAPTGALGRLARFAAPARGLNPSGSPTRPQPGPGPRPPQAGSATTTSLRSGIVVAAQLAAPPAGPRCNCRHYAVPPSLPASTPWPSKQWGKTMGKKSPGAQPGQREERKYT